MSWSERSVRHHKQLTDRAIRHAYAQVAVDGSVAAKFEELLHYSRHRASPLLDAPVLNGHHPGVDALVHLSRFRNAHIRKAAEWPGTTRSWRLAVASLAHHLVCRYGVPMFLTSSWYSTDDVLAHDKRNWFVAHSGGASFRSLRLPIEMTRRMERIFLSSPDHLTVEHAIRRSELLALEMPAHFIQAILSTRLGTDLNNGPFWRTVWFFLISNASLIDPSQIGPMIDFIQSIRHDRVAVETPAGPADLHPPQPDFSIKGRSVPSMLRLMRDWHRSLAMGAAELTWTRSSLRPMVIEEPSDDPLIPPGRWQMTELTDSAQLRNEGAALHHCVLAYAGHCGRGMSRIWSLRFQRGEKLRHVLTIEVDPRTRAIVQARGLVNRPARGKPLRILKIWAERERLHLAV